MPPRTAQPPRCGHLRTAVLAALAFGASPLTGQELPLQRDYPGSGPYVCPVFPDPQAPDASGRAQAGQLSSDASQNVILGDLERAEALLARASEVDPTSADYAYRHARVLEDLDRIDEAMVEFCRSLDLDSASSDIDDAHQRLDDLYETVRERLPDEARDAFIAGIEQADSAFYTGAASSFTAAIEAAPDWGAPVYNRAVVYEFMGLVQESLDDYRLYLQLAPTAVDPVVVMVSERIGLLEGLAAGSTPSPVGALALGLLPGMGHYYSRRPVGGTLVLTVAGLSAAAGFLIKDVTVECVSEVPAGGSCPPAEIVDEMTERPLLMPGLGVAAAVTLVGAIEALISARRSRERLEAMSADATASGLRVEPSVATRGRAVDLTLLTFSFR